MTNSEKTKTITSLEQLIKEAEEKETGDMDPLPLLYIVGTITKDVEPDGVVLKRRGVVDGEPCYELRTRAYRLRDGALQIEDDHPEWFEAGNDEIHKISSEHISMCLVAEPATENLIPHPNAPNTVVIPNRD